MAVCRTGVTWAADRPVDSQEILDSLRNSIRAMNRLWEMAVDDLTLEQMNHHERPGDRAAAPGNRPRSNGFSPRRGLR